ncbi:transglutaminase [Methyloprofundus sedimenti]|uniref:Transglutaminase n=1 Tax=Methyloprofundus sedimenti TaxID=1420851 RepID=A0A1V8M6U0_9GAMM|nr:transglutaminase family protein [Methyloprofundus sedimenti]OQK17284.1 transglutaminase [Methyloprofundus sedimenti]
MKFTIKHTTQYSYNQSVDLCHSEARLLMRECSNQRSISSNIKISPAPQGYHERLDYFGNKVAFFSLQQPHKQLIVTALSEVEVLNNNLIINMASISWEDVLAQMRYTQAPLTELPLVQIYALDSALAAASMEIKAYAAESFQPGRTISAVAEDLTQRIYQDFSYDPTFTTIATPLATVLEHKRGVCQDFAHLAIACFRSFGLPARYVSGYIETTPPPGVVKLAGSDASHAWFSFFQPDYGWQDYDPTNNCKTGEQHITLAWGRDYNDVTPLKGLAIGSSQQQISVAVDVHRQI